MQVCVSCGHQNRPGVLFCENCGTSLTGQPAAGSTKGLNEEIEPGISEQVISAGTDYVADGTSLRIEIEGGPEPIIVKPKAELIFGRRDPATGAMPDIDLTPYAGYRMGVSRRHAALRATEDHHIDVWDLGSSNGTFLNGMRLNPHRPYRVHDGDHIRLGQMVIRIIFQPARLEGTASESLTTSESPTAPESLAAPTSLAAALGAESGTPLSEVEAAPETYKAEALDAAIEEALARDHTEPIDGDDIAEVQAALEAAANEAAPETDEAPDADEAEPTASVDEPAAATSAAVEAKAPGDSEAPTEAEASGESEPPVEPEPSEDAAAPAEATEAVEDAAEVPESDEADQPAAETDDKPAE